MSIDMSERRARHEAHTARKDRYIEQLRSSMVADIEDDIEETRLEAEEALARGSHWEHQWHLDRIAWMTEHLASLRARQPRP